MAKRTVDDYIGELEEFVSGIIKKIPYGRLVVWKDLLFHPNDTIKKEMKNASLSRGAKDIAVVSLTYSVLISLFMILFLGIFVAIALILAAVTGGIGGCVVTLITGILVVIAIFVSLVLLAVIGWLVYAGFEFVIAKVLGGEGGYTKHAYLTALEGAAVSIAALPSTMLWFIPCVTIIFQPVTMLIVVYGIYIKYRIVKQVHNLSTWRAIATVLIPIIVIFLVVVALYISLFVFSFIAGAARAPRGSG